MKNNLIYYFILLLILIGVYIENTKIKKILLGLFFLFLTTSYFNGSDWRQYEYMFNYMKFDNREYGYILLNYFFKEFSKNFWIFFINMKILVAIIYYTVEKRFLNLNSILILNILYYPYLLFMFIDCPFRNLIAASLYIYSTKYIIKKDFFKFIFFILLAGSFHQSAFILILTYFFNFSKIKRGFLILGYVIIFILSVNNKLLIKIISIFPIYKDKIISYFVKGNQYSMSNKLISLGDIERILLLILILLNKNKICKNKYGQFLYTNSIIYIFIYRFAKSIPILSRYTFYFQIFYLIILILILFKNLEIKNYKLATTVIFIYTILITTQVINESYKYTPYTSYLSYLFREKPSYNYRYNYNYKYHYNLKKKNN